jgi:Ser/Thr protein kinase RdoA (MazF antagonist)
VKRDPPAGLLQDSGLAILERLPDRLAQMWLVEWNGTLGVLRRLDPAPDWAAEADLAADTAWVHDFLGRLDGHDLAAPQPLPAFGGQSWTVTSAGTWELVSYLPGDVVSCTPRPPMEAIGALLARYHAAALQVQPAGQRPIAFPLSQVPAVLASAAIHSAAIHSDGEDTQTRLIRQLAGELAADLRRIGHPRPPQVVIHGDFTNHNVVAAGQPPRPCGVIDFALAHLESPLADIGYGLWRSGRPYDQATWLDLPRIQRFIRGYTSVRPLSGHDAAAIEVFLRGRGLQMLAKRVQVRRSDAGRLTQAHWLSVHQQQVTDALADALP